ncbi:hypothetical protein KL86DYS2_12772 [uncultured Dysgonomonas sp.]|uniref:Uncharacterized protein n=1 Tax=uncultured Dysgonomonas sp. TaxID=206096 RepID=A0A212K0Y5_9BACT|nr:hypothetical protein KL86DYS2_12772 [uncultured Dysgonomonas sp.]
MFRIKIKGYVYNYIDLSKGNNRSRETFGSSSSILRNQLQFG